jgi:hypothetical protein
MWLSKDIGGCTITGRDGKVYAWPRNDDVCEVPDDLGTDLLRLGGFKEVPPPDAPAPIAPDGGEPGGDTTDTERGTEPAGEPEPAPAKAAVRRTRKPAVHAQ